MRESRNHGSVAPGWERMTSGLSWSEPVSGRTTPVEAFWTHANEDGDASARLFDVLGERTVTVCASVMSDGVRGSACTDLEFGRGPLSRFSKPGETPVSYREHLAFCQGQNASMPRAADLQTIAQKGRYNKLPQAYGAALAAGWKVSERYWAGLSPYAKNRARHVSLMTATRTAAAERQQKPADNTASACGRQRRDCLRRPGVRTRNKSVEMNHPRRAPRLPGMS